MLPATVLFSPPWSKPFSQRGHLRRSSGAVLFLLACLYSASLYSTAAAQTVQRDAAAVAVMQNALAAMGGSAVSQIRDCIAQGTITPTQGSWVKQASFTWKDLLTGRSPEFRDDLQVGGSTSTFASGNGQPVTISPQRTLKPQRHVADANPPFHLPAVLLYHELGNPAYSLRALGTTVVGGRAAAHIHTENDSDGISTLVSPQEWYFDSQTGLPLRVEYRVPDSFDASKHDDAAVEYSEFNSVAGIVTPLTLTAYQRGARVAVDTISSLTFNNGLTSADIAPPTGGQQ